MWCERDENADDHIVSWCINWGVNKSHSERLGKVYELVALEQITAAEVVRIVEMFGFEKTVRTKTFQIWIEGVRKIVQEHPGAYVALAAADGAAFLEDRPERLVVAAGIPPSEKTKRSRRRVNSGNSGDTDNQPAEKGCPNSL